MESTHNLKKRIKSVVNINKITKAMELVAATKMRRAQEIALTSRPYAFVALDLLANLSLLKKDIPLLMEKRKIKKVLFVLVSSDKGLAGSFNGAVFKKFEQHMARDKEKYKTEEKFFVAVGEKSFNYLSKNNLSVLQKFSNVGDYATKEQVEPLTDFIVKGYLRGGKKWPTSNAFGVADAGWDRVIIFSMHFKSALKQEAHVRRVLPVDFDHIKETIQELVPETGKFAELIKESFGTAQDKPKFTDYLIEPSPKIVLENLTKHLLFMQLYHLILEANAAEHSARRMAMKTASDNASELGENLNLQYNKSRQAGITNQIIEITAGAESLS
ncbi:MAG: ATP synthase F1 subunit gamma [Candidatus Staskawiczbacteria bacterium RIFCSPHIGHO2_02_FULL_34_10]|uniref:ATP synthase gamma chain n=1 Tax=Candidatus Staskawiczbacteria bacterium RIFCSPHIGHO2_02_FULL_34_10 TaxID=1802205 RepID=A0A1G2HXU1_9BACT|nr:MAG: ATP synthase F1 subunit gamma [Candidatus Staskawiczbacteria bacterium RIFCSPHIGHO2_02_FULL_34_10]